MRHALIFGRRSSHGGVSASAGAGVGGSEKDNLAASRGLVDLPVQVVGQHKLVGQFRSVDGLALLGGGTLGPQMFPPLVSMRWSGVVLSVGVHRFDLVPTVVVIAGLLLSITMIWAY